MISQESEASHSGAKPQRQSSQTSNVPIHLPERWLLRARGNPTSRSDDANDEPFAEPLRAAFKR
jgi:hypothetical protein